MMKPTHEGSASGQRPAEVPAIQVEDNQSSSPDETRGQPNGALALVRPFLNWETFGLPAMTLATASIFTYLSPSFLTVSNLTNVLRQVSAVALLAWGQAVVILSAGIDLSVGSVVAMVTVFAAIGMQSHGVVGFFVYGIGAGLVAGLINGLAITRLRLAPFIATLGMMSIARGVALTVTGGLPIFGLPPSWVYALGRGHIGPIPIPLILALSGFALTWLLLNRTAFGKHVYAIGGNEQAARLAGVNVGRTKLLIYMYIGFMTALSGLLLTGRVGSGQPLLAEGMELEAIGAVVIGGVSLFGGRGRLAGVFFGVLLMGILNNGLNLVGVSTFVQRIVVGVVIIAAVAGTELLRGDASDR
jgi:ribose transport system permease protein